MEPWIVDDPALPGTKMIDSKIYYQYHRTAQYPEEGIDFVRSHVVDYGNDLETIRCHMQADLDWYIKNREKIDKKYDSGVIAINNKRIICSAPFIDDLWYELDDIINRNSYLIVCCHPVGRLCMKYAWPCDLDLDTRGSI